MIVGEKRQVGKDSIVVLVFLTILSGVGIILEDLHCFQIA
jgi:hypothetical protein